MLFLFINTCVIANTHPPTRSIVVHIDRVHKLRGPSGTRRRCTLKKPLSHPWSGSYVVPAAAPLEGVPYGQRVERDGHGSERWGRDKRGWRGWLSSRWSRARTSRQAPQSASSREPPNRSGGRHRIDEGLFSRSYDKYAHWNVKTEMYSLKSLEWNLILKNDKKMTIELMLKKIQFLRVRVLKLDSTPNILKSAYENCLLKYFKI